MIKKTYNKSYLLSDNYYNVHIHAVLENGDILPVRKGCIYNRFKRSKKQLKSLFLNKYESQGIKLDWKKSRVIFTNGNL